MTDLTKEQMAAILLAARAKRAGISKRELFEADLQLKQFHSLPVQEQKRLIDSILRGDPQLPSHIKQMKIRSFEKGVTLPELIKNRQAKKIFLQESSFRLSAKERERLR
jgi:hypothetical protein